MKPSSVFTEAMSIWIDFALSIGFKFNGWLEEADEEFEKNKKL